MVAGGCLPPRRLIAALQPADAAKHGPAGAEKPRRKPGGRQRAVAGSAVGSELLHGEGGHWAAARVEEGGTLRGTGKSGGVGGGSAKAHKTPAGRSMSAVSRATGGADGRMFVVPPRSCCRRAARQVRYGVPARPSRLPSACSAHSAGGGSLLQSARWWFGRLTATHRGGQVWVGGRPTAG